MHVAVDTGRCQAYANCVAIAPAVFDLDDDGVVAVVLLPDPPAELREAVEQAVALCPTRAITVTGNGEAGG
jgi:ferredoxin